MRLKSRRSFLTAAGLNGISAKAFRLSRWRERDRENPNAALPDITEDLPPGIDTLRRDWVTLNRARAKVAKTGDNLVKWGLRPSGECLCGEDPQTLIHILRECPIGSHCTDEDLRAANNTARQWLQDWNDKI